MNYSLDNDIHSSGQDDKLNSIYFVHTVRLTQNVEKQMCSLTKTMKSMKNRSFDGT